MTTEKRRNGRPYTRGVAGPLTAVLLAAGESTRMGQLKALLTWDGTPLLRYQAMALLAAPVERLVVVLGYRAAELESLVPSGARVRIVHNPDYASGKVSSIVAGVDTAGVSSHVLILGVDQPRPAGLIQRVARAHLAGRHAITVAAYQGRRGHPVLFAPTLRPQLLALDEATEGLRAVLRAHSADVHLVETEDALALVNLNTLEDYVAALRLSSASSARAGNQ
jgi:molybdenum cofactor cytidylyltransferase